MGTPGAYDLTAATITVLVAVGPKLCSAAINLIAPDIQIDSIKRGTLFDVDQHSKQTS